MWAECWTPEWVGPRIYDYPNSNFIPGCSRATLHVKGMAPKSKSQCAVAQQFNPQKIESCKWEGISNIFRKYLSKYWHLNLILNFLPWRRAASAAAPVAPIQISQSCGRQHRKYPTTGWMSDCQRMMMFNSLSTATGDLMSNIYCKNPDTECVPCLLQ